METTEIRKIMEDSIAFRQRDIEERQIDIDVYTQSLKIIDDKYTDDEGVQEYKSHLLELLRTAVLEQTKVKIFLEATRANLAKHKG